jgi:hypothetical protein
MRSTLPSGGGGLAFVLLLLESAVNLAASQAGDRDNIDFSTIEEWKYLNQCVRCILQTCDNNVAAMIGCSTNACICIGSTLETISPKVSAMAADLCNSPDDAPTVLNILTAYCFYKGHPEILPTTVASSTGLGQTTSESVPLHSTPLPSTEASSISTSSESSHTETPDTSTGTAPSTTSDGADSGQGLNWAEILGIVIGITGVIVGAVAAYYTWKAVQESRARRHGAATVQFTSVVHSTTGSNGPSLTRPST